MEALHKSTWRVGFQKRLMPLGTPREMLPAGACLAEVQPPEDKTLSPGLECLLCKCEALQAICSPISYRQCLTARQQTKAIIKGPRPTVIEKAKRVNLGLRGNELTTGALCNPWKSRYCPVSSSQIFQYVQDECQLSPWIVSLQWGIRLLFQLLTVQISQN
jgi:hypothetical protein